MANAIKSPDANKTLLPLIPTQIALESLMSFVCPNCGKRKGTRKSLCGGCYHALPDHARKALYNGVGKGYEQALTEAMNILDAKIVTLPSVLISAAIHLQKNSSKEQA